LLFLLSEMSLKEMKRGRVLTVFIQGISKKRCWIDYAFQRKLKINYSNPVYDT